MSQLPPTKTKPSKVAIVVPVYNVAQYLRECLDSILRQTYAHFTVFAVDDGSTDDSGAIIDEYAANDDRIVAIHQCNAGLGAARNSALDEIESHGLFDYVAFVDGDDKVHEEYLARLIATAERTSADIVICAFKLFDSRGEHTIGILPEEMILDSEAYFEFILANGMCSEYKRIIGTGGFVWNKLFSVHTLRGVRFPTDKNVLEDELFSIKAGRRSKKNVYFPALLYFYRQRPGSAVRQKTFIEKMFLARIQTVPLAFSPRTELVATAGLISVMVNYFKTYEKVPPMDLRRYKLAAEKACEAGYLRKKTLKRFLLICNHPRLALFYLFQRRMFKAARFWKRS